LIKKKKKASVQVDKRYHNINMVEITITSFFFFKKKFLLYKINDVFLLIVVKTKHSVFVSIKRIVIGFTEKV